MSIYKMVMATIIGTLVITNTFADVKDWTGEYNIIGTNNQIINLKHTPTSVTIANCISARTCVQFGKGARFNGIVFNDDISLCVEKNIEAFDEEASKIGLILDKKITLGPTYMDN